MNDEPIEDAYRRLMNDIAHALDYGLNGDEPKRVGFVLMIFNFGEYERMNWISNARRKDMISALREMAAKLEGMAPDTKGHA